MYVPSRAENFVFRFLRRSDQGGASTAGRIVYGVQKAGDAAFAVLAVNV